MKRAIKQWLAHAPPIEALVCAVSNRVRLYRHFNRLRQSIKKSLFRDDSTCLVQTGPFKGLQYFDKPIWGIISNKWLGSYESELAVLIQHIIATPYQVIFDIGCAEGWYVVGLATHIPSARVVAFDTDPISRLQCLELARLNEVSSRIQTRGACGFQEFHALQSFRSLVICDIEGAEVELLDPLRAPALQHADILVELHETASQSHEVEFTLRQRFTSTHTITHTSATDRSQWLALHAAQFTNLIPHDLLHQAVEEHRAPGNGWLWMTSHRHA